MIRVTETDAKSYAASLLKAVGCPAVEAKIVADVMVTANLRGVDSHGILRLPIYLKRLRLDVPKLGKLINPKPKMKVAKKKAGVAIFDADRGMGQLAGTRAMALAIELAGKYGTGTVGVVNSNHFGTCAQFTCQAAAKGCVGLCFTHGESDVVPFGGTKPVLGTNPLGFAVPTGKYKFPISVDMATSIVAFGKVFQAQAKGESIPPDWALTAEGQPT
ncbi:MAG: Ldh family oxidoreductase, partial [Phycisphaerae bacterium]|nr:Ldh family oxidoreductase [Phycisphaerae bacterium]